MFGNNNKNETENIEKNNVENEENTARLTNKYKIDEKTAKIEFDNFCEMWNIDNDISAMDEDDKDSFESQKNIIVKALRQGRLIINRENKTLIYTVSDFSEKAGEELTIRRLKGSDYMAMDNYKEKELFHKNYSVIASMVARPISFISSLDFFDLKVLQACMILFSQG